MIDILIFIAVLAAIGGFIYWRKTQEKPARKPTVKTAPKPAPKPVAKPKPSPAPSSGDSQQNQVTIDSPAHESTQWPVEIESAFGEPLTERPKPGIPGWEKVNTFIATLPHTIVRWRDPKNGLVRWVDYPPQLSESEDWYFIASGAVDVTAPIWNGLWINAERINSMRSEEGLQRVRDYKGGLRSDPKRWPEPFRSAYMESH